MDNAAKIPEWALSVVTGPGFVRAQLDRLRNRDAQHQVDFEDYVARLLVATREAALREAADSLREWANIPSGYIGAIETKILALIDKEPS